MPYNWTPVPGDPSLRVHVSNFAVILDRGPESIASYRLLNDRWQIVLYVPQPILSGGLPMRSRPLEDVTYARALFPRREPWALMLRVETPHLIPAAERQALVDLYAAQVLLGHDIELAIGPDARHAAVPAPARPPRKSATLLRRPGAGQLEN